ncbi:MAG: SUMF1/EgtB/PvdO family nonheme iron enzyme, partial [Sphaerochaetaceae bacterium]|nr:SUMF1/EgtB/PvdO family nonheme iron enzyme [Sphaerochaetaceae bacterium]
NVVVTKPAVIETCTVNGKTEGGYCTRCGVDIPQEAIPAFGHDLGGFGTCSTCGYVQPNFMVTIDNYLQLMVSNTEVTYGKWKEVYDWAKEHNYSFVNEGKVGSNGGGYTQPVTGLSGLDAMTWCNALSEMEGLKPVYYLDAEYTRPLKTISQYNTSSTCPNPYIYSFEEGNQDAEKCIASGYRLPSFKEFERVAQAGTGDKYCGYQPEEIAWINKSNTTNVGSLNPNPWFIYDMIGNVAEYVSYNRADGKSYSSNADIFLFADPLHTLSKFKEIGFRIYQSILPIHENESDCVWNEGRIKLAANTTTTGIKEYACTLCGKKKTETIPVSTINSMIDLSEFDLSLNFAISNTEVTYGQWYEVYTWATSEERGANIYTFANATEAEFIWDYKAD